MRLQSPKKGCVETRKNSASVVNCKQTADSVIVCIVHQDLDYGFTETHKKHLDIIAELVEKHDLEKDNNPMRRSQCWKAIHQDFVSQTGYNHITNKQMQKKWSNYLQQCKLQYSKGLGISDIDNSAYAENSAEDDKSWRNEDGYGGSGMIESRVRTQF